MYLQFHAIKEINLSRLLREISNNTFFLISATELSSTSPLYCGYTYMIKYLAYPEKSSVSPPRPLYVNVWNIEATTKKLQNGLVMVVKLLHFIVVTMFLYPSLTK